MAQQIIQQLGFDASQAIASINQLNTALGSMNKSLNSAADAARRFNTNNFSKNLNNINKNAKNLGPSLQNASKNTKTLGTNLKNTGAQGQAAMKKTAVETANLVLSLETLSRIFIAQVLVRGFNKLTQAISESNKQTRELETRIKEIQTIAGGALGSDSDINRDLTNISRRFGLDILDVAEAKYQELSNQVDGSTDSLVFQETAAKLARATNTSLADSVNLLSSALNAFGKDASQSEEAAGILFTTIEQGRVRAGELANSFGRVAPLANALGINLNELGASIARITQGGTKADTALTQILGILNKLSKPTEELKGAFRELGVSTGLEGIRESGGLLPFLQRLQAVAGDNTTLVEFFNNVRAIQGVLALLGTDAEKTGEVFDEFTISTQRATQRIREAFGTASEGSDAFDYDQAVQDLNAAYRQLSETLVPLSTKTLKALTAGLEGVQDVTTTLVPAIGGATAAVLLYNKATTGAIIGNGKFIASVNATVIALKPFLALASGVALGAYAGVFAANAVETEVWSGILERAREVADNFKQVTEKNNERLKEQANDFKNAAQEVSKFALQFKGLRKDAIDSVTDLNREFVDSSNAALNNLLASRRAVTAQIESAIKDADKEIQKSGERQADLTRRRDDFVFNRRIDQLDDYRKTLELLERSNATAFDTRDLIRGATDLDTFDQAADALDRRLKLAENALSAAESSGNRNLIAQAEQEIVTALNDQINLEKQRTQIIEARRKAAEEAASKERQQTETLKSLTKDIRKELSFLNDQGGILKPEQLEQNRKRVEELVGKVRELSLDSDQADLASFLGIEELASRFDAELRNATQAITAQRGNVQNAIKGLFEVPNDLVDTDLLRIGVSLGLTSDNVDQFTALNELFANGSREVEGLTNETIKFDTAVAKLEAKKDLFRSLFAGTTGAQADVEAIDQIVERLANDGTEAGRGFAEKFVAELGRRGQTVQSALFGGSTVDIGGAAVNDIKAIQQVLDLYDGIVEAQREVTSQEVVTQGSRERLAIMQNLVQRAQENIQAVKEGRDVTSEIVLEWNGVQTATQAATQQVQAYSRAIKQIPSVPAPPSGGGTNRMFGGMLYRNAGGFARGTDTIPAMLSPGEFVVNAKSSRKYASQLNAINSDANPTYRSEGGPMTTNNTVNVGDINVNGTADPDDTARRVVSQLRREFRRGTTSRF